MRTNVPRGLRRSPREDAHEGDRKAIQLAHEDSDGRDLVGDGISSRASYTRMRCPT